MSLDDDPEQETVDQSVSAQQTQDSRRPGEQPSSQYTNPIAFMTPASMTNTVTSEAELDAIEGPFTLPDDCFNDPTFDWFAWFNQEPF